MTKVRTYIVQDSDDIRLALSSLLKDRCPPSLVRSSGERGGETDFSLWQELLQGGWGGLAIPETAGGMGQEISDLQLVLFELGRSAAPVPIRASVVTNIQFLVKRFGPNPKIERLAREVLGGAIVPAAVTEAGWLPQTLSTHATTDCVEGQKKFVRDADAASVGFLVAARSAENEVGWYRVSHDPRTVGVLRSPNIADEALFDVEFKGAAADLLATGPNSTLVDWHTMQRLGDATWGCGLMSRLLEMTVEYSKDRVQFGRPIGTFQAVQHALADIFIGLQMCLNLARSAALSIDKNGIEHPASTLAACQAHDALRRYGSTAVRQAHQIFGGAGLTLEHDLQLFTRRLKGLTLFGEDASAARSEMYDTCERR